MSHKYSALLQPLQVRGVILRNRMLSTASTPHFLQGTEKYPGEKVITHFANRAKNGAAAISINHFHQDDIPFPGRAIDNPPGHFNLFELDDSSCQNYMCQLIDAIHFYGSKATAYLMSFPGWMYPDGKLPFKAEGMGLPPMPGMGPREPESTETDRVHSAEDDDPPVPPCSSYTKEMLENYCRNAAREASDLKRLGFDIISLHSCYRHSPHARFLSPLTNDRTDEYGPQTVESRSRFLLDIYRAIREAVGPDTPLEVVISVDEAELGGYTVEDTIEFCRLANGLIDIIHLRAGEMDPQHPLGFTSTEAMPTPYLDRMALVTKAVREMGLDMVTVASAGFQDPAWANQALAEGKADLIGMARSWINNEEYGRKVLEERGEDIVPCIRCNKCHVSNGTDMWRSVCSVNPRLGLEDKLERMVAAAPEKSLRCAVIGGGPAGMEFARVAAERGHRVTLYEASDALGGQLRHADYPSFKWPLRRFKDFMAAQVNKLGVDVRLNTRATREMLEGEGYDVIVAAVGAAPKALTVPGADGENVHYAPQVYGAMEDALSDEIVMIGGGEVGVETALYLCELGKHVTVLARRNELIPDAPHAHYKNMVHNYWRNQPNFRFQCGVTIDAVEKDGVLYTDSKGVQHKAPCGDVLVSIGARAQTEKAMEFAGIADRFYVIGDCDSAGNVQKAMRSAFGIAVSL